MIDKFLTKVKVKFNVEMRLVKTNVTGITEYSFYTQKITSALIWCLKHIVTQNGP